MHAQIWLWLITTAMLGWDEDIYTMMAWSVALAAAVVVLPLLANAVPQGLKDKVGHFCKTKHMMMAIKFTSHAISKEVRGLNVIASLSPR